MTGPRTEVSVSDLRIVPIGVGGANDFVRAYHRHHGAVLTALFAVGVADACDALRGVAIIGIPNARMLTDGYTAEVVRVCTDGARNACSMLYGASWRGARALGYTRLVTYTLPEEGGASLRATGWLLVGDAGGGSWSLKRNGIDRPDAGPTGGKLRWEVGESSPHGTPGRSRQWVRTAPSDQMTLSGVE